MPHALTLLKTDHREVDSLFDQFEKTSSSARKRAIADKIVKALAVHAAIEEMVFYPAVRKAVKQANDKVLESLEEHHVVKWMVSELEDMKPEDERFEAKMSVLCENVRHHVKEEETQLFPMVRKSFTAAQLNQLGTALEAAKKAAPRRAHPRAPDTPPVNVIVGLGAAAVDRAREMVRGLAKAGARRTAKPTRRPRAGGTTRARGTTTTRRGTRATAH